MTTIHDRLALSDMSLTPEGFLVAKATIARTGVQDYRAHELGIEDADPNRIIRVYRPPEEVFDNASMKSFAGKPVTDGHPATLVTSKNARKLARGFTSDSVTRDGDLLATTVTITDHEMIETIQTGTRQTSNGYEADVDLRDGKTPEGVDFDAIMSNIRGNHVAVVDAGRCGGQCRIGDDCQCGNCASHTTEVKNVTDTKLRSITVDGISIETTEQSAQVIDKLQRQVSDQATELSSLQTKLDDTVKAHDKALGEKDAEIKKLTDAQASPEDIDRLVRDRQAITEKAKLLDADIKVDGKTIPAIRREAVAKVMGADLSDKSDEYIEGQFDTLVADAKTTDPIRDGLRGGFNTQSSRNASTEAYNKRLADDAKAWQNPGGSA